MEEVVEDGNESCALCATYLEKLRSRYGATNPMLIRPDKVPAFAKLDQDWCAFLQEHGWCKMERVTKWMPDETGLPKQFDLTTLRLLDPALKFLERCKVTVETHTDSKVTIEPETETKEAREARRQFSRTDRGIAILNPDLDQESMLSDIDHHVQAIKSGVLIRGEFRGSQYWLKYWLLYRWRQIPENVRREAIDCRDLDYATPRRRAQT